MAEPLDWADLTDEQIATIITSPAREVDVGCELLNADLTVAEDISTDLKTDGADVTWNGLARVHRDCKITLSRVLPWGISLVRLYEIHTDKIGGGLSARRNIGAFCLTAPDQPLGEDPAAYAVTGQDRTYLLDRQVGRSYVVPATTNVVAALGQAITDAGLTGVRIDSTRADATVPTDMVWPLIPAAAISSADEAGVIDEVPADLGILTDDTASPATWRRIINDLAGLIGYRGVWADEDGYYRLGPYADPASRAPTFTMDATDTVSSVVAIDRTVTRDLWSTPNTWIFVRSNMPDVGGVPATPTEGDGLYTVVNTNDGPSSIEAMGGLAVPVQISYTAADQAALVTQGNARVAADKRATTTAKVNTVPFPQAGHFDVFTWRDDGLDESTWKVEATSWRMPLGGGDTEWTWTRVG